MRAVATALGASYRTERFEGDYEGLSLVTEVRTSWVFATLALPTYTIDRNGVRDAGLGDVLVAAQVPLVHLGTFLRAGVGATATLPTGSAKKDLGMGHVMLMPNVWLTVRHARWALGALFGYGKSLAGDHSHHHGAGPLPIVNPMNTSEFQALITADFSLTPWLFARANVRGAVPVGIEGGESRATFGVGPQFVWNRWDFSAEGQLPLLGDPFRGRVLLTVGHAFE